MVLGTLFQGWTLKVPVWIVRLLLLCWYLSCLLLVFTYTLIIPRLQIGGLIRRENRALGLAWNGSQVISLEKATKRTVVVLTLATVLVSAQSLLFPYILVQLARTDAFRAQANCTKWGTTRVF